MATTSRPRRRARGRLAGAAFSLLVHAGVLAALLASVRTFVAPEAPVLEVELIRPSETRPAAPATPRPPPPAERPVAPEPARARTARPLSPLPAPTAAIAPPAPRQAATAAVASAPARRGAAPAAGGDDDVSGRVRSGLRTTIGCDDEAVIRLSAAERAACARRRAQHAREAMKIPPSEAKRRAWAGGRDPTKPSVKPFISIAPPLVAPAIDMGTGVTIGVGVSIPFGHPPKALPPIPPSTLHGNDRMEKVEPD